LLLVKALTPVWQTGDGKPSAPCRCRALTPALVGPRLRCRGSATQSAATAPLGPHRTQPWYPE